MDKRFFKLFALTEAEAIALLDTPLDQLEEGDSRYVAASHLVNYSTEQSINALIRAVQRTDSVLANRIARRKAIESLGRLEATQALPFIRECLNDEDCYTVENAVWAIGEMGTDDGAILADIAQLLERPGQSYRVIIHALAKLNYAPALERVRPFINSEDAPIASAATATVCRWTQDYSAMDRVVALLQSPSVFARRLCIQDLIDAQYLDAIPDIARCPISLVFRLRGIRALAEAGVAANKLTFETVQPHLEQTLRDHPSTLNLVHRYDQALPLATLIHELYETDFGRSYLATQTLLETHPAETPAALFATYEEEAHNDYGAHFHVMKLFGWLKHQPAYDLLIEALNNKAPQFQKSRAAAAIALGELGDTKAIPEINRVLGTPIWDLKYAALMALEKLGDTRGAAQLLEDPDWLVRAKAQSLSAAPIPS